MSFIELVKYVFTIPGVTALLSEKICQDPLENFFGCQRQRGGTSNNPTVAEFCKNTQALRIVNSLCTDVKRGNSRGKRLSSYADGPRKEEPLAKRRRSRARNSI